MVDTGLARYVAAATSRKAPLAPTAGYGPGADGQGGEQRIDHAYADPHTAERSWGSRC
ncbi:hypothetical protein [Kitasatospora sp. NPDC127116]|uniref:hypothetical protein n=1 Tax=Kitasatospora sp. NPDC127116 TaxID=3345367 RepID=UPI00362E2A6E